MGSLIGDGGSMAPRPPSGVSSAISTPLLQGYLAASSDFCVAAGLEAGADGAFLEIEEPPDVDADSACLPPPSLPPPLGLRQERHVVYEASYGSPALYLRVCRGELGGGASFCTALFQCKVPP